MPNEPGPERGTQPLSRPARPLVIGHRGACGYRPEHTIASYRLAIAQGADVIEPDVVATRDGVLIARHESEIGSTTDVRLKFPHRRATRTIDGRTVRGWFSDDFTLAEIRTLRARERLWFRSRAFDGEFAIPTFDEIVELAQAEGRSRGRPVAVYPETKHPSYFRSRGLPLEERLVESLEAHGLTGPRDAAFIQSFDPESLRRLRPHTGLRLMLLLDERGDISAERLGATAAFADGIGPHKRLIVPASPDGRLLTPTTLVHDAHAAGLFVHVWTMRSEPIFLSPSYRGDPEAEVRQFGALGVDGIFTDFPDIAVRALDVQDDPAARL